MVRAVQKVSLLFLLLMLSACAGFNQPLGTRSVATTANPYATSAALRILQEGGSATDAAIAAQMVLGLVEPQSSGIGGGAVALHWNAKTAQLTSYDGLAAAPSRVTAALQVDIQGQPLKPEEVVRGGRSVGVPGTLSVLKMLHERHGRLPWSALFTPAIELARTGFALPRYLHTILSAPDAAKLHPELLALYFDGEQRVLPIGATITHPEYATTLASIAQDGPATFLANGASARLSAAAQRGAHASLITPADVLAYRPETRPPLCAPFLQYKVCAMGPTSFGGIVVLQMLQVLEARIGTAALRAGVDFNNPEFVHLYAEAGRLAQADRLFYVGDPRFVAVPTAALLANSYLLERARAIDPLKKNPLVKPGEVGGTTARLALETPDNAANDTADATSQVAIVDAQGNAISLTTTNNLNFGSRLMVDGYILNNAMTNFSGLPRAGQAAPNRMEAGKRPVTSMAPLMVFDASGLPILVGGSAGGGQIVDYIVASVIDMLANQRTPAQALARGNISTAVGGKVQLEKGTSAQALEGALTAKGHSVEVVPMPSGQGFLKKTGKGWIGAADPRRDGVALGF